MYDINQYCYSKHRIMRLWIDQLNGETKKKHRTTDRQHLDEFIGVCGVKETDSGNGRSFCLGIPCNISQSFSPGVNCTSNSRSPNRECRQLLADAVTENVPKILQCETNVHWSLCNTRSFAGNLSKGREKCKKKKNSWTRGVVRLHGFLLACHV